MVALEEITMVALEEIRNWWLIDVSKAVCSLKNSFTQMYLSLSLKN